MRLSHLRHDEIAVACDHAKDHGFGEDFIDQKIAEARKKYPRCWAVLPLEGCCYLRYYYKKVVLGYFCQHFPYRLECLNSPRRYSRVGPAFERRTMEHVLTFLGANETELKLYLGTNVFHRLKGGEDERQESPK